MRFPVHIYHSSLVFIRHIRHKRDRFGSRSKDVSLIRIPLTIPPVALRYFAGFFIILEHGSLYIVFVGGITQYILAIGINPDIVDIIKGVVRTSDFKGVRCDLVIIILGRYLDSYKVITRRYAFIDLNQFAVFQFYGLCFIVLIRIFQNRIKCFIVKIRRELQRAIIELVFRHIPFVGQLSCIKCRFLADHIGEVIVSRHGQLIQVCIPGFLNLQIYAGYDCVVLSREGGCGRNINSARFQQRYNTLSIYSGNGFILRAPSKGFAFLSTQHFHLYFLTFFKCYAVIILPFDLQAVSFYNNSELTLYRRNILQSRDYLRLTNLFGINGKKSVPRHFRQADICILYLDIKHIDIPKRNCFIAPQLNGLGHIFVFSQSHGKIFTLRRLGINSNPGASQPFNYSPGIFSAGQTNGYIRHIRHLIGNRYDAILIYSGNRRIGRHPFCLQQITLNADSFLKLELIICRCMIDIIKYHSVICRENRTVIRNANLCFGANAVCGKYFCFGSTVSCGDFDFSHRIVFEEYNVRIV